MNRLTTVFLTVATSIVTLLPVAHGEAWRCNVTEPLEGSRVTFSTGTPVFRYDSVIMDEKGNATESRQELVTVSTVSTLKIKRERCSESSNLTDDGQKYFYSFGCEKWVRGFLLFRSDLRSGTFSQNIVLTADRLTIKFSDCTPLTETHAPIKEPVVH